MKKKHRNSQKRLYFEDAVYFVSCKTEGGHPFFKEKIFCDIFVENLRICKKLKGFYLYAWVLIYNHFHLLIRPNDKCNISEIIQNLKRTVSLHINQITQSEGANIYSRLHWSSKLIDCQNQFHKNHPTKNPHPRFQWQKSYHDHYIRNDSDFDYHWEYIEWNPEKHNMPNNWKYVFINDEYEDLIDESI